jgi:hypothetical protein
MDTKSDTVYATLQQDTGKGLPYTISDLMLEDLKTRVSNPSGSLLTIMDYIVAAGQGNIIHRPKPT